jgi:Uncharacterised nucleotidyltransferase
MLERQPPSPEHRTGLSERAERGHNRRMAAGDGAPGPSAERSRVLWDGVDAFLRPRIGNVEGLVRHGLAPLAADILERDGRALPAVLEHEQQRARLAALAAPALVARVRGILEGPVLVLKGPEVAARYPGSARRFGDVDLLVPDAAAAQRALVAAGFVEAPDPEGIWVGIHHLPRIAWPGVPLDLEIHTQPKWPAGRVPPSNAEVFAAAVPSRLGVGDVLAPDPAHHALLVAAHGWAHQPLANFRDLLDAAAVAAEADPSELERLARRWGIERLWRTTAEALAALLAGGRTAPLRLWAGHVGGLRAQTVLEQHLERVVAPFWGMSPGPAARHSLRAVGAELRPAFDEGWGEKARRTGQALRRLRMPVPAHDELLGDAARRGQRRNPRPQSEEENGTRP